MMQQPTVYQNVPVGQSGKQPGNLARRLTYTLLIILVMALMAGGLYWVQWAAQRGLTLGYPQPTVRISALSSHTLLIDSATSFSANATGRGLTYSWDFGDSTGAVGSNVSHAYQQNGSFTATVTVTDALGQSSSASTSVQVYPPPPVASFTVTYYGYGYFIFDASASTADPSTSIAQYMWDFGDGNSDPNGSQLEYYTYSTTGQSYTVTLTVVDGTGQQSSPFTVTVTAS